MNGRAATAGPSPFETRPAAQLRRDARTSGWRNYLRFELR